MSSRKIENKISDCDHITITTSLANADPDTPNNFHENLMEVVLDWVVKAILALAGVGLLFALSVSMGTLGDSAPEPVPIDSNTPGASPIPKKDCLISSLCLFQ